MVKSDSIAKSMVYKTLERYSVLAFQMVVQIVIARILSPEHYGVVAMMMVFISVANIFIHNGFNMAIVQKKKADSRDFGTALFINFLIGLFLYAILFFCAPIISRFYNEPILVDTLRVMSLILPLGSVSSIQTAIATRNMEFKHLFKCHVCGSIISGLVGVILAYLGAGVWALIIQQITNVVVIATVLTIGATWKPKFDFVLDSAKEMFSFGWKLLTAGLINQLYNELNSLVIGKKYSSADLAYFTKGRQFPNLITGGIDSALQSVSLAAFSKKQDDFSYLHSLLYKTITINSFILFPLLIFLAAAAKPITILLLTEKWIQLVPYIQICCIIYIFHPVASIDMQVIAAIGRSDLRLKLEFIKKPIGIILLIIAVPYGPMAIAISTALTSIISLIIGALACQRVVGYSLVHHFKDIIPAFSIALAMGIIIYFFGFFELPVLLLLIIQAIVATTVYVLLAKFFRVPGYDTLKAKMLPVINKFINKLQEYR